MQWLRIFRTSHIFICIMNFNYIWSLANGWPHNGYSMVITSNFVQQFLEWRQSDELSWPSINLCLRSVSIKHCSLKLVIHLRIVRAHGLRPGGGAQANGWARVSDISWKRTKTNGWTPVDFIYELFFGDRQICMRIASFSHHWAALHDIS